MGKDIIEYLEKLVLILFTKEEKAKLIQEVERIIEMFNMLNAIENLEQWEPLYHVHDIPLPLRNDDEVEGVDEEHNMLKDNAILIDGYVKAPKTITE